MRQKLMGYNTETMRQLISTSFNDEELYTFCYDNFNELSKNFTAGQTQNARVQMLIEYCERNDRLDQLVRLLEQKAPKKFKQFAARLGEGSLNNRLTEILKLYLNKTFKDDQYARLDQAGESDSDRSTLLRQVFIDLEVKPTGPSPQRVNLSSLYTDQNYTATAAYGEKRLSAMKCLLHQTLSRFVLIGGPGQGKSTLGQYVAQAHRAVLIGCESELEQGASLKDFNLKEQIFIPKKPRIPFRIILKYFAQWLDDGPPVDSVEAYLAVQLYKTTSREVTAEEIQEIIRNRASLVIFDGLDEVIEPELRVRLLNRIEDFLDVAEQLNADLQVVATSRPTGYSHQFNPQQFWHLELQPMSTSKVREYGTRWVYAKEPIEEEQRRILDTLSECQQEEHTRLLLTTPLQVTIVLLIIKDRGRPPAQREALFHEYWGTIFRREKAKAKGFIRTEESLMFDLHAYLGYLLHRRASKGNVRSLLPTEEFEEVVHNFLRRKDSYSAEAVVKQRTTEMVKEARDRLVLLVEPEPGLFGFELRSLQEFFAAVYMAQTARDTAQRFNRLKAIARSEHWHNVALFFAGRVVRTFSGEAANILELVCRPIDREQYDLYLRRGAWLALDVAADSAFASNRDLQYGALEYALTTLESCVPTNQEDHFKTSVRRVSPEDIKDILKPTLEKKLNLLPLCSLDLGLDVYGQLNGGNNSIFLKGLERLISAKNHAYVMSALNLGFTYKVAPEWIAEKLDSNWNNWATDEVSRSIDEWWTQSRRHFIKALLAVPLTESRAKHLLNIILENFYYSSIHSEAINYQLTSPDSLSKQIILMLECKELMTKFALPHQDVGGIGLISLDVQDKVRQGLAKHIPASVFQRLLLRSDLLSHLRMALWAVYWHIYDLSDRELEAFIKDAELWNKKFTNQRIHWRWIYRNRPLVNLMLNQLSKSNHKAVEHLKPYLNWAQDLNMNNKVRIALHNSISGLSRDHLTTFLLNTRTGDVNLPEINDISLALGVPSSEILDSNILYWTEFPALLSSANVDNFLSKLSGALNEQEPWNKFWFMGDAEWSLNKSTIDKGKELLIQLIERLPQQPELLHIAIILFLKLLEINRATSQLTKQLLAVLSKIPEASEEISEWWIIGSLLDVPLEQLRKLIVYTEHKDRTIREGSFSFWMVLIKAILSDHTFGRRHEPSKWQGVRSLRFDWEIGIELINNADKVKRKQGISLLSMSEFPLNDKIHWSILLEAMAKAEESDEVTNWSRLLRVIPITELGKTAWFKSLEEIITRPNEYHPSIIKAAIDRYAESVKDEEVDIRDEASLGLPSFSS
jgi:Effector-associated domain 7